jgi:transposase-like protein
LLSIWRQQRRDGALDALRSRKRGPKPRRSAESWQIEQLERENVRLREELRKAEVIIEVQKKVSRLLSNLETDDDNGGRI